MMCQRINECGHAFLISLHHMISRINWRFMSVNEKSEKVLEQYDIGIRRMVRGRGGIIVMTDKGCKLFIQCDKADKYYERENRITELLSRTGYTCIDTYMRNKNGLLISEDEDGRKYIMKNWFDAKESNVRDENDMCMAVSAMAYMHMALRKISPDELYVYSDSYKADSNVKLSDKEESQDTLYTEKNAELRACQKAKKAGDSGMKNRDITNITGGTDITGSSDRKKEKSYELKNRGEGLKKGETELRKTYAKHTRELKKAYNYLRQKKGRQPFEQMAFKNIEVFYEEACRACEHLMSDTFDKRLMMAAQNMELSHGSYTYHNVLINGKATYVVNFDRYRNECQINDLYQFIRKVMEKYNWDSRMFYRLVDEYDRICPLTDEEMELLLVLLSYPEKFWKIINQYINSNKSWIPEKNVEKLRKVIEQNGRKRELIDKICCVW